MTDISTGTLLAKATHSQPLVRGLLLEDTPQSREIWGEELFLVANRLSLTPTQYDAIDGHYSALEGILSGGSDPRLAGAHIFVQGSIRARTAILPHPDATGEHAEVDADAVVWLPHADPSAMETYEAVERRLRDGTRTRLALRRKNRCLRLRYQDDNPAFHMDVTPARNAAGNHGSHGEGCLEVPDCSTQGWKPSAPTAYADWFANVCDASITLAADASQRLDEQARALAKATSDPLPDHESYIDFNPLRAAVKLLKAHRDTMFLPAPVRDLRPISIVLATLAARAYERIVAESVMSPRNPADALIEVVARMPQFIQGSPGRRVIANPVIDSENFAEKWCGTEGMRLEEAFYAWHREAVTAIKLGLWNFPSQEALHESIRVAFGRRPVPRGTDGLMTRSVLAKAVTPSVRAPKEQFIADMFPVMLTHQLSLDCEERKAGKLLNRLLNRGHLNRWLPYGRELQFFVRSCSVPQPYDLYWKVRNVGAAARRRNMERGEIVRDEGHRRRKETTDFSGEHYVEAYIVKNGVCVAKDRISVPIDSR
jgi:hypothetical protein